MKNEPKIPNLDKRPRVLIWKTKMRLTKPFLSERNHPFVDTTSKHK